MLTRWYGTAVDPFKAGSDSYIRDRCAEDAFDCFNHLPEIGGDQCSEVRSGLIAKFHH